MQFEQLNLFDMAPIPERPIWQARRVRAIRDVTWKVDYAPRTWFRAGREYECLAHHIRDKRYLSVMFAPGRGIIAWSSDCNDHPEKYRRYKRLMDDTFFMEHFEILEWGEGDSDGVEGR